MFHATPRYALSVILGALTSAFYLTPSAAPCANHDELVVDAVIASVNGKPITLEDLRARLNPPRNLSYKEATLDPEARQVLDLMIFEDLIEAEAEAKKVNAGQDEVERYVDEVARRNNLSRQEFELALTREKKDLSELKRQLRIDILKSKLTASILQAGTGVSSDEVEKYLSAHPELSSSGAKVKLRQIFISSEENNEEAARKTLEEVRAKLTAGEDFGELASKYSESEEKKDGGLLGVVPEKDLSPEIFDAIFSLKAGEYSAITKTGAGLHIFKVDERFPGGKEDKKKFADEVKKILQEQKAEEKMQNYFTHDIYRLHAVDKKI